MDILSIAMMALKLEKETTDFNGEHIVECFAIQNGVVVAKGRIKVPIQ